MKRKVLLVLAILLSVSLCITGLAFAKKVFVTIATGSPGGVYYPLGIGMAAVIQETVEGVRCAAESTGASVENTRLISNRESDMGMVMASIAYAAREGWKPFVKKHGVLAMFQMYRAPMHIVTLKDSGIKTLADLKGKKVSIDQPGSGGAVMSKVILKAAGFDLEKDLKLVGFSVSQSVLAMQDGVVDAIMLNFAYPAAAVVELDSTRDIDLIPMDEGLIDKIIKKHPYYVRINIPKGIYKGIDKDILCLGDANVMVVHKDMNADLVYKCVKGLFENVHKGVHALVNIHPIAKQFTPENAINSPIPLHPGSIKYFKERGVGK